MSDPCAINLTIAPTPNIQLTIDQQPSFYPITLQVGPPGPPGPASVSPQLELHIFWQLAYPTHYLAYSYDMNGVLTDVDMYADATLAIHVMNKHFIYVSTVLSQTVITYIPDSTTETRTYFYSGGNLVNQQVTQT